MKEEISRGELRPTIFSAMPWKLHIFFILYRMFYYWWYIYKKAVVFWWEKHS